MFICSWLTLMLSTGMLFASLFEKEQLVQREAIQLKPYWEKKNPKQQVGLSAKCPWLLRTTKQTALILLGHLQKQKCHQIHKQLVTCQNKCHKTKSRHIIQLKGFLRAIYNGNLSTLTRGSLWLAALCHSWCGISQPSLCPGLHKWGSTAVGQTSRTPVHKYRLPFQTSKRCLRLFR